MILITGIVPIIIISGISVLVVNPFLTRLDEHDAIEDMDHVLDLIEHELNYQAIFADSLTLVFPGEAPGDKIIDRDRVMDLYSIDFLALSDTEDTAENSYRIRTAGGVEEFPDIEGFLDTVLEGPYAPGRLVPSGFIRTGTPAEIFMLSSSAGTGNKKTVVIGRQLDTVLESYRKQYPEKKLTVTAAPENYSLKTISSFSFDKEFSFDPVKPQTTNIIIENDLLTESVVLSVPYLETGLLISLTQPSEIKRDGNGQLFTALVVIALLLVIQIVLVTFWMRFRISRPLNHLILGIEKWDGLRLPDIGELKSRPDEIGSLARTFFTMSGEIRSKTRSLEDQAVRDGLTGLYNRRRFDETLQKEWNRHKREGNSISLIMADIDFFKSYNDTYGHQEGDECLRAVAQACMEGVRRPGDLPFRYGGEEFSLILAGTSLDGATAVAENIRKAVENLKISAEGSPLGPYVTMSFGVSDSSVDTLVSKEELVRSADDALYQAKKNGRNRVVSS